MDSTKDRLIVHAATLFANNGCKSVTMDDIANSAGVSKRTIYENFRDKEALLKDCIYYFFEYHELDVKQILQSSDNIIVAIFKLLENTSKVFFQLKFNFLNEVQKYYPDTYNHTIKVYKQQYIENTDKLLQKGKLDSIIREEINPTIIAVLINEISIWVMQKDILATYGFDKKEAMHTFMNCITRGMFTDKGMQILNKHIDEFRRTKTPSGRYF